MPNEIPKSPEVVLSPFEEFRAAHDSFQQTVRWIQNGNPKVELPHPAETFEEEVIRFRDWRTSLNLQGEATHGEVITYRIERFLTPLFDALLVWSASLSSQDVKTQAEVERLATLVLEYTKMASNRMQFGAMRQIVEERILSMERGLQSEFTHNLTEQ